MDIRKYVLPFLHAAAFMYTTTAFMCSLAFSSLGIILSSFHSPLFVLPGLLFILSVSRILSCHFHISSGAVPSPRNGSGMGRSSMVCPGGGPEEQSGLLALPVCVSAVFAHSAVKPLTPEVENRCQKKKKKL